MIADFKNLIYAVEDEILTITLNRPEALNALNLIMAKELVRAFDLADADDGVKAIIVTGSGRAFCAGADLSVGDDSFTAARVTKGADGRSDYSDESVRDWGGIIALRIFRCLKPVIAAVNGAAVGIGATMQLPMDIRIASTGARFGFVFAKLGIVPEAASSWFLPRIVGISTALEWCYSGRVMPAQDAYAGGLLRSLHAPDDLISAARSLAREIIDSAAPVSIALTRQLMWRMMGAVDPMEAHRIDSRAIVTRSQSADAREGIAAFLEKRSPNFAERPSCDMPDFFPWWDEHSYS
ncbi:crotonase/enoyl-CoA hydratase family protein [Novosphingobium colocasiae]|uniref:Enoyl-CoA hydratase n=1 Tax=Novosphingobium colocasiae TaxID=1256513 RepID=A0A918PLH9_9SPHN|nr:crotonase/enoyl-CoA hydratase family protein [Novosphingobium colocasiae]GGZ15016.1 enoyl-CoA hydratase [Novosphingobium colocasiae]